MKKNRIAPKHGIPNYRKELQKAAKIAKYDLSELTTLFIFDISRCEDGTHVMRICPVPNPLAAYVDITNDNSIFPQDAIQAGVESLQLAIVSGLPIKKQFPANAIP